MDCLTIDYITVQHMHVKLTGLYMGGASGGGAGGGSCPHALALPPSCPTPVIVHAFIKSPSMADICPPPCPAVCPPPPGEKVRRRPWVCSLIPASNLLPF